MPPGILEILLGFFQWLFSMGAPVIVPVVIIILGLIFRAPMRSTLVAALRMGVGFTGLYALIMYILNIYSSVNQSLAKRFGVGTVPDLGWPVFSGITFSVPWSMVAIAGLMLLNAVLVVIGLTSTLNVDAFNHWPYVYTMAAIYLATGNWILAILGGIFFWFITLKMADWTYPFIEPYYNMPGISIPHCHTVNYAPFGFLLDRVWDRIPVIKDIKLDPDYIRTRFGIVGEPIVIGFVVGLVLGALAYLSWPVTGQQVASVINVALATAFFMVLLPRAAELIVMGFAPLSQSIRDFIMKRMPGREFHLGLDVAVLVGAPEHVALGALAAPFFYLVAYLLPGNRVIPLADVAGYTIFFTVWAVNTNHRNLFRGLLNSILVWFPLALWLSNLLIPINMKLISYVGYTLPQGVSEVTCITIGSNFFASVFLQIMSFIAGVGTLEGLITALAIFIVWLGAWYITRDRPKEYAKELKGETG